MLILVKFQEAPTMAQYDIPIARQGFSSLSDAKAHYSVVGKLQQKIELATSAADECREADKVEVGKGGAELYKDLAAGQGHVIMLSQPEGSLLRGAELSYNPADGSTKSLILDMGDSKLTQQGSTFKLEEEGVTTYFKMDDGRGVLTVLDAESEVPRIFGDADPNKLVAGTIQIGQPMILF